MALAMSAFIKMEREKEMESISGPMVAHMMENGLITKWMVKVYSNGQMAALAPANGFRITLMVSAFIYGQMEIGIKVIILIIKNKVKAR